MRFYLILFFCVSLFFTSCKDEKGIPSDVIPEHDMAELLTDIHIVDGSLYDIPQMPDSLSKHGLALYLGVFKAHHVDTALFNKSLKFYTMRPDLMNEIYTGITDRLQKKIDSLQKIKPKINADSVKKAEVKRKADSVIAIKKQMTLDSISRIKSKKKADSLLKTKPILRAPKPVRKLKLDPHAIS